MNAYTVTATADGFAVVRLCAPHPDVPLELHGPLLADVARAILADFLDRPALLHEVVAFEHRFLMQYHGGRLVVRTIPAQDIWEWIQVRGFGPDETVA